MPWWQTEARNWIVLGSPEAHYVLLNGEPVRLLLWRPKGQPPWPLVVRMHGTTETADDLPEWTADLLEAGIAVLSFSGRKHGERGAGLEAYRAWLRQDLPNNYLRTLAGTASDLVEAVGWARGLPEVNGTIGLWGGSFGATCCLAAARLVRPRAVSSVCGLAGYTEVMRRKGVGMVRPEDVQDLDEEAQQLIDGLDLALHVEQVPPAAVLLVHGDNDTVVPPDGQRILYERLEPLYREMPERLAFLSHPGGHPTPPWCERAAVDWLRFHLAGG